MRKKLTWISLALFAVGFLFLGGAFNELAAASTDNPIKWRLQSAFPPGSFAYDGLIKRFIESVETRTNGRLVITPYPPGALAKVLEIFDAVAAGAVDMAFSAGLYHARKIPEGLAEFGLPFSFTSWEQPYEYFYEYKGGEAIKILRAAYEDRKTYLLAAGPTGQYGFMTKFPVKTVDDFKGKKMRTFGLFSVLAKKMGGAPVSIPGAEQYLALQRGTIDGTIYPYYVLETYKLKEVVNYVILPPVLPTPMVEFYINLKAWQNLPDESKKIAEETVLEVFKWYSKASVDLDWKNMDIAKKVGVKVITLPDEEVNKLRAMSVPVWDIAAGKSEKNARLVEILKAYLKDKGL
jgi:TRAP-type C4-dicarboxylate transport system substrate-binding protein